MKLKSLLAAILGLALALSALTGVAGAGKPDDPGKSEDAPGQVKKAEEAPPAGAASEGKPASAAGQTKTEIAAEPAKGKSAEAKAKVAAKAAARLSAKATVTLQPESNGGRSAEAHHHVIICHATGSATNPFVVLNIPMTAWTEAHDVHQDGRDFILKDPASRPGSKDGFDKSACGQVAPAQVTTDEEKTVELQACPPVTTQVVTTTDTVVRHHAGPTKVVEISPSEKSAHFQNKHPDDAQTVTETKTIVTAGECPAEVQVLAAEEQKREELQVAAQQQQQQPPAAKKQGGVLGAQAGVPPAQQGQGGVLGEVGAITSSELPFTGIQLWIVLLAGIGLLAAGVGARKAMH